jgi:hypothetical protein
MSHLSDDDLTLLYYGDLPEGEAHAARAHLDSCETCRREEQRLQQMFAMVNGCTVPEPDQGFEAQVWRRLQPALRAASEPRRGSFADRLREWLLLSRGWAIGGALAAAVLVAFALGRSWQPAPPAGPAPGVTRDVSQENLRERVLLTALGDHFDRTQAVLVELASTTPSSAVDISSEQRRAHDLLAATRIYRRAATEAGDRTVRDVLEALERVLVEVDVSPSQLNAYELRSLQNRIDEQALLFKVRVAAASVREREQSTRPAADPGGGAQTRPM